MTIVLHVYMRLKQDTREEFLKRIRAVAEYTHQHEKDTHAYVTSISSVDPLDFYIFEMYTDENAWKVTHMESEPAKYLFHPTTGKIDELVERREVKVSSPLDGGFLHK